MSKLPREIYDLIMDYKHAFEHRAKFNRVMSQLHFRFFMRAVMRFYRRVLFARQLFLLY